MPVWQPVTYAQLKSMFPSNRSRACDRGARLSLRVCLLAVWVAALSLIVAVRANCQTQTTATSQSAPGASTNESGDANSGSSTYSADSATDRDASTTSSVMARRPALSADQITQILQQSPDLVVELKSQLADRMQQQGIQINESDISDEMLFSQIASNVDLRTSITTILRARGYVSDDDLQSSASSMADQDGNNPQSQSLHSQLPNDGGSAAGVDAAVGTGGGLAAIDGDGATAPDSVRSNHSRQSQVENPRGQEKANASTDMPKVL